MPLEELAQLAQILHSRHSAIANHWYRIIAPTSFTPLSATQVRQCLDELTDQVITLVLASRWIVTRHAVSAPSWQTSITSRNIFARKGGA